MSIEQKLGLKFPIYWSGAAIEKNFAHLLIYKLITNKPIKIIELGSGISTLIIIKTLEMLEHEYDLYSIDSDEITIKEVENLLKSEKVFDKKKHHLIYAPIVDVNIDNKNYKYYDPKKIIIPGEKIDLLLIDGPFGALCKNSRYPALSFFSNQLNEGSIILLDDANRLDEKETVSLWQEENNRIKRVWNFDTNRGAIEIRF